MRNRHLLPLAFLVALLTFLAYLPTLWYDFVNWDDAIYVYANKGLELKGLEFLRWASTAVISSNWHPLTILTLGIEYEIWGLAPSGYHATSALLHALNTGLVVCLSYKLLLATEAARWQPGALLLSAAFAGLLFGLHPLHVESVAWISEKKDLLCGLFFILSLIWYLRYATMGRKALPYALSLLFAFLASVSKPMAVSLPVVLLAIDLYPLKRLGKESLRAMAIEKAPFILVALFISIMAILTQDSAMSSAELAPLTYRFFLGMHAFFFYIYKTAVPYWLAPIYPHPLRFEVLSLEYAGSLAMFIVVTLLAVFSARKSALPLAAWLAYIIMIVPVAGFVQVGIQAAADRYMYLPSLALFIPLGALAGYAVNRRSVPLPVAAAVVLAVSIALSVLTIRQERIWKDSLALWSHEIAYLESRQQEGQQVSIAGKDFILVPQKVLPYHNRAMEYMKMGEHRLAIADFSKVLEANPDHVDSLISRGILYGKSGEAQKAVEDFGRAITLDPNNPKAYHNRGMAYEMLGEQERADNDFRIARALRPANSLTQ